MEVIRYGLWDYWVQQWLIQIYDTRLSVIMIHGHGTLGRPWIVIWGSIDIAITQYR